LIILSAMLGFFLLRVQGTGLLQRMRSESAAGRVPDREIVHGAMLVLAAFLLIVPGFVTSAIGLLLFIPFVRDLVWDKLLRGRMVVATTSTRYSQSYTHTPYSKPLDDRVIDLDPEDYSDKPNDGSPWSPDKKDQ